MASTKDVPVERSGINSAPNRLGIGRLLVQLVLLVASRSIVVSLICGALCGGFVQLIFIDFRSTHVITQLLSMVTEVVPYSALLGMVVGLFFGLANGIGLALLSVLYFTPPDSWEHYRRSAGALCFTLPIMLVTCWFIAMIGLDFLSYLSRGRFAGYNFFSLVLFLLPLLVVSCIGWYVSGHAARWYMGQVQGGSTD
ncbi:MAG: hypothetical protein OHK0022_54040 [Roseiflexaceae bacterium]